MSLSEEIPTIFQAIKPHLIKIAFRYNIPNRAQFVDEWQSNAFFIAKKFDEKHFQPKATVDGELQPAQLDDIAFLKNFEVYLKTAFRNDLNHEYHRQRKHSQITSESPDYLCGAVQAHTIENSADITDLLEVAKFDLAEIKASTTSPMPKLQVIFMETWIESLKEMFITWGKHPVIPDITNRNTNSYFNAEFEETVRDIALLRMAKEALKHKDSPVLFNAIKDIVYSKDNDTMRKRLYRYLYKSKGGVMERISAFKLDKVQPRPEKTAKSRLPLEQNAYNFDMPLKELLSILGELGIVPAQTGLSAYEKELVQMHLWEKLECDKSLALVNSIIDKVSKRLYED